MGVHENSWYSPGEYAADFQVPVYLAGNYCTSPFSVAALPANDYDKACFRFASAAATGLIARDNFGPTPTRLPRSPSAAASGQRQHQRQSLDWPTADVITTRASVLRLLERAPHELHPRLQPVGGPPIAHRQRLLRRLPSLALSGEELHVSRYSSIQAAINAAYNDGTVLGTVVDDRTSPYTGPGFILYDSVTLKLGARRPTPSTPPSPTTTATTTSPRESSPARRAPHRRQHFHQSRHHRHRRQRPQRRSHRHLHGRHRNRRHRAVVALGRLRKSARYRQRRSIRPPATASTSKTWARPPSCAPSKSAAASSTTSSSPAHSATPSDIANITTNSAGRYGFNFNNLSGVAVVHGLSGDSNTTSTRAPQWRPVRHPDHSRLQDGRRNQRPGSARSPSIRPARTAPSPACSSSAATPSAAAGSTMSSST